MDLASRVHAMIQFMKHHKRTQYFLFAYGWLTVMMGTLGVALTTIMILSVGRHLLPYQINVTSILLSVTLFAFVCSCILSCKLLVMSKRGVRLATLLLKTSSMSFLIFVIIEIIATPFILKSHLPGKLICDLWHAEILTFVFACIPALMPFFTSKSNWTNKGV